MRILLIILVNSLMLFNCKKSTDPAPCSLYTGITETDAVANVYGKVDNDDWKPAGILSVGPAYPNPFYPMIKINFNLAERADIKITINNSPKSIVRNLIDGNMPAGNHDVIWNATDDSGEIVRDCIYRVYYTATKDGVTFESYGDIKLSSEPPR